MAELPVIHIRPVQAEDVLGLSQLEQALIEDGRGVVKLPRDLPARDEDEIAALRSWLETPRSDGLRLVQLDLQERIVGEGSIQRFGPSLLRHVALLSLGIHPRHQGRGLGRQMMNALLAWARSPGPGPYGRIEPVLRVELYVRADNERAVGLYRSLGFAIEGTRRRFVRLPDGSFVDDHVMALHLG